MVVLHKDLGMLMDISLIFIMSDALSSLYILENKLVNCNPSLTKYIIGETIQRLVNYIFVQFVGFWVDRVIERIYF